MAREERDASISLRTLDPSLWNLESRKRGLLSRIRPGQGWDHPIGDTICLAPPLVVTEAQVDRSLKS
jgi:hypothetical protein